MSFRYIAIILFSLLLSAFSQVLLKLSANKKHTSIVFEYLNLQVLAAYMIFFLCLALSSFAYKGIQLKQGAVLETLGFFYVLVFDRLFFNQQITFSKIAGNIIIITGIVIFFM